MPEILTIAQALKQFRDVLDINNKNTRKSYIYALGVFTRYLENRLDIDTTPLSSLTVNVCLDFGPWMNDPGLSGMRKPYSNQTRNLCTILMKRFVNYYRPEGLISFSPETEDVKDKARKVTSKKGASSAGAMSSIVDLDFGERMLAAAVKYNETMIERGKGLKRDQPRHMQLNGLRALALVSVLADTGLRISDAIHLTKIQFNGAKIAGGYLKVQMIKTGEFAHVLFSDNTMGVIDEYLALRDDISPWLFIQHGRGVRRERNVVERFYIENYNKNRGYGMRMGDDAARVIIGDVAEMAGYKKPKRIEGEDKKTIPHRKGESGQYVSPHAFRHWLATSLKNMDMPIDDIQNVLGHKSPETTKLIYAPRANEENIKGFLSKLHDTTKDKIESKDAGHENGENQ